MATQLTTEKIAEFQKIFQSIANDKKIISPTELRAWIESMGQDPTDEDLEEMIDDADLNKTGYINFFEFLVLMDRIMTTQREVRLRKIFDELDRDEDGYIKASDLREVMTELSMEEAHEMIREANPNGNGKVSYSDFQKIMGPS
ncbi:uncharacterized protein LOC144903208 [Branchiostoma floridae x Branchiostoma belcheri]